CCFVFFFKAEDGIRDWSVTGVQTCALPISPKRGARTFSRVDFFRKRKNETRTCRIRPISRCGRARRLLRPKARGSPFVRPRPARSEERRVGEKWRSGWGGDVARKKEEEEI